MQISQKSTQLLQTVVRAGLHGDGDDEWVNDVFSRVAIRLFSEDVVFVQQAVPDQLTNLAVACVKVHFAFVLKLHM